MMFRVLIAEDQTMPRQLFSSFAENAEGFTLAKAVSSGEEAVHFCKNNRVDLAILDVVLGSGMNGLEAARQIKRLSPKTKIIIVTSMAEVNYIKTAREIGVESFWYKEIQEQPIIAVMERTMNGESVYPDRAPVLRIGNAKSTDFTPRELEILREMTTGATNKEIAEKFSVTVDAVKLHISNMLQKTGYKNRVELAVKARADGLVIGE